MWKKRTHKGIIIGKGGANLKRRECSHGGISRNFSASALL
ncbi:MAG: hypothetical protein ACLR56_03290 [Oscillospiraceae bacterium]